MKIAILTLPLNVNMGGLLQAYALQKVLERLGHDVRHIQPSYALPSNKTLLKRLVVRFLKSMKGETHSAEVLERELLEQFANYHINKFREKYIKETPLIDWRYFSKDDYDAFIVGSDQIWRHQYAMRYFPHNFLEFTKGQTVKRIAYAASFGTEHWELSAEDTLKAKDCIQRFESVSVRENGGVEMCKHYFGINAECVLDPTMLLLKEDYLKIIEDNETPQSEGTLLSYVLNTTPTTNESINNVALNNRLIPFRVNNPNADQWHLPAMERQQYSVYKWLRGFQDAQLVITDSFHACVFAIIFNKSFIVVGNKDRGLSRFETLLSTFGLKERLLDSNSCTKADYQRLANTPIDYSAVNKILTLRRKESLDFLKNALSK